MTPLGASIREIVKTVVHKVKPAIPWHHESISELEQAKAQLSDFAENLISLLWAAIRQRTADAITDS